MNNRIPWSRLLFEGVVVVISILVAFAIDAWWDSRKVKLLEEDFLARLEVAFEENAQLAERAIERGMDDSLLLEQFIQMTPEEAEQIPPNQTWAFLRALLRPNLFSQLNTAALTAILDAGQLSAESDPQLLTTIAEWRATAGELDSQNDKLQDLDQEVTQALSFHHELQREFSKADRNVGNSEILLPGSVTRRIREDNEVISRAARKGQASFILHNVTLPGIQRRSEKVLELIRTTWEN
jgi:hypothetical protein